MEDTMFTKKLGFGLMRLPLIVHEDRYSVDMETFKRIVDTFLDRGSKGDVVKWLRRSGMTGGFSAAVYTDLLRLSEK
jgi:hypothetical protein